MANPILYHDADYTALLLDIPASLERAQESMLTLASCPARNTPYVGSEPKGQKRESLLGGLPVEEVSYHSAIQATIEHALSKIQESYIDCKGGSWYRKRLIRPKTDADSRSPAAARASRDRLQRSVGNGSLSVQDALVPVVLSSTELRTEFPSLRAVQEVVVHNPSPRSSLICLGGAAVKFFVPPHATFIQATLEGGRRSFSTGAQAFAAPNSPFFDLIVMDPPWTNRSVRRSSHYRTAEDQTTDPFDTAVGIVQDHLIPQSHALVAVWITNRNALRRDVLQSLGALQLELHQEWIWIKIAANGQPVTQLDGVWRRPYEICLLFQRGPCPNGGVRRRVIAAVPDLHSRKPSLKCLFEPLLPPHYSALELFARTLTAGWWSWGDEVLKFQHESHWGSPADALD